jgi:hypothetical protein
MWQLSSLLPGLLWSTMTFSYDVSRPIWEQTDRLYCEKTYAFSCYTEIKSNPNGSLASEGNRCLTRNKFNADMRFYEFRFQTDEFVAMANNFSKAITAYNFETVNKTFSVNSVFVGQNPIEFWRTELGLFKAKEFYTYLDIDTYHSSYNEYVCIAR